MTRRQDLPGNGRSLPGNARAIGYARVSSEQQRESGLGLDAQRTAIEQTAARLRRPLAGIHTDAGLSGSLDVAHRPALADALSELRRGDVLIVAKRDRLSRDAFLAVLIEREIEKKGARIISAAGEGTESDEPSARFNRRVLDAVSELERGMIAARTRAALRAKRARGERAGTEPYGQRVNGDGRTLHAYEPERQILTLIADCRAAGYSLRATADELNRRGFTTRAGTPWRFEYVRSLLRTVDRHTV